LSNYVSSFLKGSSSGNSGTGIGTSFLKACSNERVLPRTVAILHTNLANAQMKLGRVPEALESAKVATQVDNKYPKGFYKLAESRSFIGETSLAMEAIQSASLLAPADPAVKELMRKISGA